MAELQCFEPVRSYSLRESEGVKVWYFQDNEQ